MGYMTNISSRGMAGCVERVLLVHRAKTQPRGKATVVVTGDEAKSERFRKVQSHAIQERKLPDQQLWVYF